MDTFHEYLTPKDVERLYKRSVSALAKDRISGDGPPFYKMGSRVLYLREDLDNWMSTLKRSSTSQEGSYVH